MRKSKSRVRFFKKRKRKRKAEKGKSEKPLLGHQKNHYSPVTSHSNVWTLVWLKISLIPWFLEDQVTGVLLDYSNQRATQHWVIRWPFCSDLFQAEKKPFSEELDTVPCVWGKLLHHLHLASLRPSSEVILTKEVFPEPSSLFHIQIN